MRRIYVTGPISGLPERNRPVFNAEAARLRRLGFDVVNPAELNPGPTKIWHDCMRTNLTELLTCDTLALLPGWQAEGEAHLEVHLAHRVGMAIVDATDITESIVPTAPTFVIANMTGRSPSEPIQWLLEGDSGYTTEVEAAGEFSLQDALYHNGKGRKVILARVARDKFRTHRLEHLLDATGLHTETLLLSLLSAGHIRIAY